jgi:hypothetical protein
MRMIQPLIIFTALLAKDVYAIFTLQGWQFELSPESLRYLFFDNYIYPRKHSHVQFIRSPYRSPRAHAIAPPCSQG